MYIYIPWIFDSFYKGLKLIENAIKANKFLNAWPVDKHIYTHTKVQLMSFSGASVSTPFNNANYSQDMTVYLHMYIMSHLTASRLSAPLTERYYKFIVRPCSSVIFNRPSIIDLALNSLLLFRLWHGLASDDVATI